MICSTGKDLICLPHIKICHSLHTSSTVPKKPNLTTTTKLLTVLSCPAEATVSCSVTFSSISLKTAASPVLLLSQDQELLTSTTQWKRSPPPVLCSLVARPNTTLRCPVEGTPQKQAHPPTCSCSGITSGIHCRSSFPTARQSGHISKGD